MAISSWMIWGRGLRSNRAHRGRQDHEDVQFDLSKEPRENIKEALINICQQNGIADGKKLAYFNALTKLVSENENIEYGYTPEELFCCLRVGLVNEATQVRAAALRAVRYLLKREQDVIAINKLQYPYLLARSMDITLRNEIERIQALRLVRRILALAPKHFSPALARSLISVINGGTEEKDRAFRVFLMTLCELGALNSGTLISCGGVGALVRAAMTEKASTCIESVIGILINLLCNPDTRNSVSLLCLAAPYCELPSTTVDRTKEDRDQSFTASKHALLSVLRSYPGVIHFCHPNDNCGMKAICDILYVDQLEVRGAVLELFYELLDIPLPTWTDEPDVALAAVDPSRFRESWKLTEGFIAAEGRTVLPSLTTHCPNITEIHLALLIYVLLECGLHRALAETIVSSDTFISVRAAVLLGTLLHLAHTLLPPEVCDLTPPLPNLLEHASSGRHQALAAVTILSRMHAMMRRKPSPASLFLDRLLQAGSWLKPAATRRKGSIFRNWLRKQSPISMLLKDSQVLSSKDALTWNWSAVRTIVRSRDVSLFDDSDNRLLMKRLVRYFKPSANKYCRIELATNSLMAREATLAGCELINYLLDVPDLEATKLLTELVEDIDKQIVEIKAVQSAHDAHFSPRFVTTTCCQKYFLFIGLLSHSTKGLTILESFNLLEKLQDLAITTNHDCYVKLITSSLDYSWDGPNRKVLEAIIKDSPLEGSRLYATQFLRLILRAKMTEACQWAMSLLLASLNDSSKAVALAALDALNEACEKEEFLNTIQSVVPNWEGWLEHLDDRGYLLKIRLYALSSAFKNLPAEELEKWIKPGGYAERYVGLVESSIHDALTRRQRDENGRYLRRRSTSPIVPRDAFVPSHLIGQLVQHDDGMQLLLKRNVLQRFARIVQRFRSEFGCGDNESCSKIIKISGRFLTDEVCIMSEESGTDDTIESCRLETIIDSEVMEMPEMRTPQKTESLVEIRRKLSLDDSRRTTPERSWRQDYEQKEDNCGSVDGKTLRVKSALWALGHAGTSAAGVEKLNHLGIIELITNVAETCSYYAVRATAMYALSLISTTHAGADVLMTYNWPCVRYSRGEYCPVVAPSGSHQIPSPQPVQRHHRSLSDGKPEFVDLLPRRTRNRSESAATDLEARRYALSERGETPSPVSSIQRLSQQDAEGYAKLRTLQRHRRPSYSQSSLEMYSIDGRQSLLSLLEFESSRILAVSSTPSPPVVMIPPQESDNSNLYYMGISLPRKLAAIFPDLPRPTASVTVDDNKFKSGIDEGDVEEELLSEYDTISDHSRICLTCYPGRSGAGDAFSEANQKIRKEILRHAQRLENPVFYRHSRQTILRLRQQCPEVFEDACLFSEVAARLASGTYRIQARRFLQELFLECSFPSLFTEPAAILQLDRSSVVINEPAGAEQDNARALEPTVPLEISRSPGKSSETKINGRLVVNVPSEHLDAVTEETTEASSVLPAQNESKGVVQAQERVSDEKIIAEILKPEERMRLLKGSEKILKASSINTAMSLD